MKKEHGEFEGKIGWDWNFIYDTNDRGIDEIIAKVMNVGISRKLGKKGKRFWAESFSLRILTEVIRVCYSLMIPKG